MSQKRYTPEQIIGMLREAEARYYAMLAEPAMAA